MDSYLKIALSPFTPKGKLRSEIADLLKRASIDTSLPFDELVAQAEAILIHKKGGKLVKRWEIPNNVAMSPDQQQQAQTAGLFNKRLPRAGHYDYLALNSGTFMPTDRIFQLLRELVENDNYSFGKLALMASRRKLNPEKDAFELLTKSWPGGVQPNKLWQPNRNLTYDTEADMVFDHMWPRSLTPRLLDMEVVFIHGDEAANTRTLFKELGERIAEEKTVLSLSDAPHGPYQALAALRGLGTTGPILKDFAMTDGRYGLRRAGTMYDTLARWLSMWLKAMNEDLVPREH